MCVDVCMCVCVWMCVDVCGCMCMCVDVCIFEWRCEYILSAHVWCVHGVCVWWYVCVCVCMCMCEWKRCVRSSLVGTGVCEELGTGVCEELTCRHTWSQQFEM